MKVLILSCNTGAGHNSCARALQEAIMERGIPCDIRDGLSFLSKEASRLISKWHVRLYRKLPRLYGEGYSLAERKSRSMDEDSMSYRFFSMGANPLRSCIISQGYTHVICTHLFPAMTLTHVQRNEPLDIATAFVATDYTASPGYDIIDADWCFVPAPEVVSDFVKHDMPEGKIIGSGMPVSRVFRSAGDKAAAKRTLGINENHRHLLVMSGSMGCGPLKHILRYTVREMSEDVEISVICGSNSKLSRRLSHAYSEYHNVHIHDFVDHVALFMDSADLFMTKSGGLSVSEAMCKRLPMALIQAVEGCETYNMRYCLQKEIAVTTESPLALARMCAELIHDDAALEKMRKAMEPLPGRHATDIICDRLFGSGVTA